MTALRVRSAKVYDCTCERCGYQWRTLTLPTSCAKCKSKSWNVPEGSVPLGRPAGKKKPRRKK